MISGGTTDQVNASKAKTHLSQLFARDQEGMHITITKHIRLLRRVPAGGEAVVESIRLARKGITLGVYKFRQI